MLPASAYIHNSNPTRRKILAERTFVSSRQIASTTGENKYLTMRSSKIILFLLKNSKINLKSVRIRNFKGCDLSWRRSKIIHFISCVQISTLAVEAFVVGEISTKPDNKKCNPIRSLQNLSFNQWQTNYSDTLCTVAISTS
jgi:hypothetical protein